MLRKLSFLSRWARQLLGALILSLTGASAMAQAVASDADELRATYTELGPQLRQNQFGRPLVLNSAEAPSDLKGDIYAVVDHPFATVSRALDEPAEWCDVLILHLNTKYCRASGKGPQAVVAVGVGRKFNQPVADAYRVAFAWKPIAATPEYLEIQLNAPTGPLDTKNYSIALRVIPIADGRSFIHLRYSYGYGFAGRVAMKTYLATAGSDKVGFTRASNGYIGGVRGVVERNAMRYYLAIEAYLGALATPPAAQLERRLQAWFVGTERYSRQLHEIERDEYLAMKRDEYRRQQEMP